MFQRVWQYILRLLGFTQNSHSLSKALKQHKDANRNKSDLDNETQGASNKNKMLYQGIGFPITNEQISSAKTDLFWNNSDQIKQGPTKEQEQVIFSSAAAASVLAGAGSGKSTTLVSRVLFLHKYLGVPFETMAVFTFTRKSRQDFIDKLLKEAKRWGVAIHRKGAERLVRTFHSKALQVSKELLRPEEKVFEFLGKKISPVQTTNSEDDQALNLSAQEEQANETEGLIQIGNESPEQQEILKEAYVAAYNEDVNFKIAIGLLFNYTLTTTPQLPSGEYEKQLSYLSSMSKIDVDLCDYLESQWQIQSSWPIPGIATRQGDGSRFSLNVKGTSLFANGYIPQLKIYVILGEFDGINYKEVTFNRSKFKPKHAVYNKRIVLLSGCKSRIRYVRDKKDAEDLKQQLGLYNSVKGSVAPAIELRLPGEFGTKPAYLALFNFGVFVENLGLDPRKLTNSDLTKVPEIDRAAIYTVSKFYSKFYAILSLKGIVTFNQIFTRLGIGSDDLKKISISSLMGVKHLMIDEFQDISPLIVNFVLGLHNELLKKSEEEMRPTLLCVGDDWQSIYGWRGSSPHFFIEFHNFFPGASSKPLKLEANFRSSQKIIDCGESFLKPVSIKSDKRGIASNSLVKNLPWAVGAINDYKVEDVKETLDRLLKSAKAQDSIYLLAISHAELVPFKNYKDPRLIATTFHQSKGLEAEFVILLGAPTHYGSNPLRNFAYNQAEFKQTYDQAQHDEAFRLAYVAATRAKRLCLWFAKPTENVLSKVPPDGNSRIPMSKDDALSYIDRALAK